MPEGERDLYAVLGVDRDASAQEIRQRYRQLALAHHPDRGGDPAEFSELGKAYEILSDEAARGRYDSTGSDKPLSFEDQFRFGFFGGGAGEKTVMEERRERERRRAAAEFERQKAEDFQGLRPIGVDDAALRRQPAAAAAAHGGSRLAQAFVDRGGNHGGERHAGAPPAAAAQPTAAAPPSHPELGVGDRVELFGIKARPEMNGLTGILVAQRDDRWQICLDDDLGDKLVKTKNLRGIGPRPAAGKFSIVASPLNWAPRDMAWDAAQRRYTFSLRLDADGRASFQIWEGGDPGRCLHPKRSGCSFRDGSPCCGPDGHGKDRHWAIGAHPLDGASPGAFFQVRLHLNEHGVASRVDWARATAAEPKAEAQLAGDRCEAAAKLGVPTREYEVLHDVIYVRRFPSLDSPPLGRRTRGSRISGVEETFDGWVKLDGAPGWVLRDMRGQRGLHQLLSPADRKPVPLVAEVPQPGALEFEVVFGPQVVVRMAPTKRSPARALMERGAVVRAESQTYNGWLRLVDGAGWMLSEDPEHGKLLVPRGAQSQQQPPPQQQQQQWQQQQQQRQQPQQPQQPQQQQQRHGQPPRGWTRPQEPEPGAAAVSPIEGVKSEGRRAGPRAEAEARRQESARGEAAPSRDEQRDRLLDELLQGLAAAAASGDALAVRRARDAAKRGGVSAKDIARVYALHSQGGERAEAPTGGRPSAASGAEGAGASVAEAARGSPAPAIGGVGGSARGAAEDPAEERLGKGPASAVEDAGGPLDPVVEVEGPAFSAEELAGGLSRGPVEGASMAEGACSPHSEGARDDAAAVEGIGGLADVAILAPSGDAADAGGGSGDGGRGQERAPEAEREGGGGARKEDAPQASEEHGESAAVPPSSALDGEWYGPTGEHMATILGDQLHWADGPACELVWASAATLSTELFGHIFTAERSDDGRLLWSDGDVWSRDAGEAGGEILGGAATGARSRSPSSEKLER